MSDSFAQAPQWTLTDALDHDDTVVLKDGTDEVTLKIADMLADNELLAEVWPKLDAKKENWKALMKLFGCTE
jgi:hypothetical protein